MSTSILSTLYWGLVSPKDYSVFEHGELQTVQLNRFQRFFRALGFYRNTHLSSVVLAAQTALFSPNQNFSVPQKDRLIVLTRKAFLRSKLQKINFGKVSVANGATVQYEGYWSQGRVNFKITWANQKETREARIQLLFNQQFRRTEIAMLNEYPQATPQFLSQEHDPLVLHTYSFLSKVLKNSEKIGTLTIACNNGVGSSLQAMNYGFLSGGHTQKQLQCDHITYSSPKGMFLMDVDTQRKHANNCPLENPVSLDFLTIGSNE